MPLTSAAKSFPKSSEKAGGRTARCHKRDAGCKIEPVAIRWSTQTCPESYFRPPFPVQAGIPASKVTQEEPYYLGRLLIFGKSQLRCQSSFGKEVSLFIRLLPCSSAWLGHTTEWIRETTAVLPERSRSRKMSPKLGYLLPLNGFLQGDFLVRLVICNSCCLPTPPSPLATPPLDIWPPNSTITMIIKGEFRSAG